MLKFVSRTATGKTVLMLGLSGENVTRLMADEPIRVDLAALGREHGVELPEMELLLIGGRTESHVVEQLQAAGVKINIRPMSADHPPA